MLVAEQLGVAIDDIEVVYGDTDVVPRGAGTMGSRSLQIGGAAVDRSRVGRRRGEGQGDRGRPLEADREDIVLDKATGQFHVVGTPAVSRSSTDLAEAAAKDGRTLFAEVDLASPGPTFPFGTHISVVEVDTETGKVCPASRHRRR